MDLVATMKDEFDQVTKKQKLYHSVSQDVVDPVCDLIEEALRLIQVDNNGVESKSVLTELRRKLDALLPIIQIQRSQKEVNTSLGKFVKVLENSSHLDISQACRSFDFDISLVNEILIHHLYREGLFDVGDCLVKEAGEEEETKIRSQSLEIYEIVEAMKVKDIEPALRWISKNCIELKQNGSKLELQLRGLKFIEILREGKPLDALEYARTHFPQYSSFHFKEIQQLVTCLLWVPKLEKCPYTDLLSPSRWDQITKELIKEYYNLLNLPSNSPLTVTLSAGFESLPVLLKLVQVMALKKQQWQDMKQLPVPLELSNEFQFHSVFVCPVSREQSSDENPPMMLPCHHVISKQSMIRICKNCSNRIFKCSYCGAETSAKACMQLYF